MLELKNIKKIYRAKKSEDVVALDDVSLTFPETGLVFILGKSGSGKSTLLNIIGGLDDFDSGDIFVDGKSRKAFSSVELDSYRSRYLGFVFQEYNLLDDFNVYDNVALSLQLQSKDIDSKRVEQALADVDMSEYSKRMPNELSGGQKQRVSIARALVKNPKIILADEPTGALDSKTGKQIFETLKRLSEERLVIVVSHDQEAAKQYANRIIEIQDGRILSDSKEEHVGTNQIDGKSSDILQNMEKTRFPVKQGIRMGIHSIFLKKGRLILTVLLSSLAFALFGTAASISTFSQKNAYISTVKEDGISSLHLTRHDNTSARLSDKDEIEKNTSAKVYSASRYDIDLPLYEKKVNEVTSSSDFNPYYLTSLTGALNIEDTFLDDSGFKLIAGRLPENSKEACLSKYAYESFKAYGIHEDDYDVPAEQVSYDSVIDMVIGNKVITGIVDTSVSQDLQSLSDSKTIPGLLSTRLYDLQSSGVDSMLYSRKGNGGFYLPFGSSFWSAQNLDNCQIFGFDYEEVLDDSYRFFDPNKKGLNGDDVIVSFDLLLRKIRMDDEELGKRVSDEINSINQKKDSLRSAYIDANYLSFSKSMKQDPFVCVTFDRISKMNPEMGENDIWKKVFRKYAFEVGLGSYQKEFGFQIYQMKEDVVEPYLEPFDLHMNYQDSAPQPTNRVMDVHAVGVSFSSSVSMLTVSSKMMDENMELAYSNAEAKRFHYGLFVLLKDQKTAKSFFDYYFRKAEEKEKGKTGFAYSTISGNLSRVRSICQTFKDLLPIFYIASAVLALFSILLFYSFMSSTIQAKEKQIGTLRALGAGKRDVMTIFFSESISLSLINLVVSCLLVILATSITSSSLKSALGLSFSILSVNFIVVLALVLLSLLSAFLASLLPVYRISNKKPVDAISGK